MFLNNLSELVVFHCISPLHAGSGQSVGAVDLPIQRERHTAWPQVQASGVKGAFRDWFFRYYCNNGAPSEDRKKQAEELTKRVFGREEGGDSNNGNGQAGAISFSDARLLAFPVRSTAAPFVWVTCPSALTRFARDLAALNTGPFPSLVSPKNDYGYIVVRDRERKISEKIVLEDLAVIPDENKNDLTVLKSLFESIAPNADRLIMISDLNFTFLVKTATEIQPQIEINMETGTATKGSLRYQELLPSDSVLYSLVFFCDERIADPDSNGKVNKLGAEVMKDYLKKAISTHIQMGGDVTLGRGLMETKWVDPTSLSGGKK
jgi:CRISPR-associated protein Cmr4